MRLLDGEAVTEPPNRFLDHFPKPVRRSGGHMNCLDQCWQLDGYGNASVWEGCVAEKIEPTVANWKIAHKGPEFALVLKAPCASEKMGPTSSTDKTRIDL